MVKRCSITLDFLPKDLDNYADFYLLSYSDISQQYVDVYEKYGQRLIRLDIAVELEIQGNLKLISIYKAIFPRIKWSDRQIEQIEKKS
jgi:hypothetical protein